MKNKSTILIALALLPSLAATAHASPYSLAINSMISMGMADKETVKGNCDVYQNILNSILTQTGAKKGTIYAFHTQRIKFIQSQINNLKKRYDAQMGTTPDFLKNLIAPEAEALFTKSKPLIENYDYDGITALVIPASNEINEVLKNI